MFNMCNGCYKVVHCGHCCQESVLTVDASATRQRIARSPQEEWTLPAAPRQDGLQKTAKLHCKRGCRVRLKDAVAAAVQLIVLQWVMNSVASLPKGFGAHACA